MNIGPYEIIHRTDTVKLESYVAFWTRNGRLERATNLGKRGGFRSMKDAVDAVTKIVKFGTTNV